MQVIKPYANLINPSSQSAGIAAIANIEYCARISHRSEEKISDDFEVTKRFIKAVVIDHGDWSVTEHSSASVEFVVDRGITHEIVRHRLFSFTQESTRFVNYEKSMPASFICPFKDETIEADRWYEAIIKAEDVYKSMIKHGVRPQEARSVFPNALSAKLIMTGNFRAWRWFFLMRTTKEAHPQMKEVTIPLLEQFKQRIPILYDDILPNSRQIENAKLAH